jgi:parallel beta-helix repeat protein
MASLHVRIMSVILLTILSFWSVAPVYAAPVTDPIDIDQPGTYLLQNNILNSNAPNCINISSSDVIFDGMGHTIQGIVKDNSTILNGIFVQPPDSSKLTNVTIRNVTLENWSHGIVFSNSEGKIADCKIYWSYDDGIRIEISGNLILENNTAGNGIYRGISIIDSDNLLLANNTANANLGKNGEGGVGIVISNSTRINVTDNHLLGNALGSVLWNSSHSAFTGNEVRNNNRQGIKLFTSDANNFTQNQVFDNNEMGIIVSGSQSNNFTRNIIRGNTNGLLFESGSTNNSAILNNLTGNLQNGIILSYSSHNVIGKNNLSQNGHNGIYANNSVDNILFNNTAIGNVHNGIAIDAMSNANSINNNTLTENGDNGIYMAGSSLNRINGNTAKKNGNGIALHNSDANNLTHNYLSNNTNSGIYANNSADNILFNNTAIGNLANGIALEAMSNTNSINNNTLTENVHNGIYLAGSSLNRMNGNTAKKNGGGIALHTSNANNVTNNYLSNNTYNGIYSNNSSNNFLVNNTAIGNVHNGMVIEAMSNTNSINNNTLTENGYNGIYIAGSSLNTLNKNIGRRNGDSIGLAQSNANNITNNYLSNNTYNGISLHNSTGNTLFNNTAIGNVHNGIILVAMSTSNSVNNNTLAENGDNGIYLAGSSQNSVNRNVARYNGNGIGLNNSNANNFTQNRLVTNKYNGIYLDASGQNRFSDNYLNNTQNAHSVSANIWNITKTTGSNIVGGPYKGGNYWATPSGNGFSQTCPDGNRDGICDTAYTISPGNIDQLPLVIPTNIKSDIGVFRNSTHLFYLDYNGNGVWNGSVVDRQYNFGLSGDLPVSGDWNNDGKSEIGVFRNSTHTFYLDYNANGVWNVPPADRQYNFGLSGDLPISGDWNNDRKSEIGVYRNSTKLFYLDYNGNGVWNGSVVDRQYNFSSKSGDLPVSGDWNNNGISEIGVFRNSTHMFYLDYNGNGVWNGSVVDRQYNFGLSGDLPITGDWNNNGISEIGVYRNSTKLFYLDYNGNGVWNGSVVDRQYNFSTISGDKPISGKWS